MMMRKICLLCCLVLSLAMQGQTMKKADEAQSKAMVESINRTAASIRSIACSFTQVKSLRFLNDKMTSQGRMYYDASGKLRWEYTSPYQYIFILNGQNVYIKSAKTSRSIDIRQSRLSVRLHISSTRRMVSQVEMTETSGDTTVITLKNVKTNERIDEKLFTVG